MNKLIRNVQVVDQEIYKLHWNKFVDEYVQDAAKFDFQELETAFMCGWATALEAIPALFRELERLNSDIAQLSKGEQHDDD